METNTTTTTPNRRRVSFKNIEVEDETGEQTTGIENEEEEVGKSIENDTLSRHFNKFQLLDEESNSEEDNEEQIIDDDDSDSNNHNQKETCSNNKQPVLSAKTKQRNKRRNKAKAAAKKENLADKTNDELLMMSGTSTSYTSQEEIIGNNGSEHSSLRTSDPSLKLLKLDLRTLIPDNELKRMFGKSVIKEEKSKEHRLRNNLGNSRSRFVSGSFNALDPRAMQPASLGPKMELDDLFNDKGQTVGPINSSLPSNKKENQDSKKKQQKLENRSNQKHNSAIFSQSNHDNQPIYFKFVHDKSYQAAQSMFLEAAIRGHSEGVIQNFNIHPTHVESLIQLSDMIRISEDFKTASELIERALLIFERGFHPKFNFSQANCRLSYKRPENRSFFITIFKHISYLNRRGLRRTPLEYCKFLLSLDPENDPLFATLLIDFYAIRSEEYDYIIEFHSKWQHLSKLPNMNFSLALAHFMKSLRSKRDQKERENNLKLADECLQRALIRYPNFIIPLLDSCSAEPADELKKCDYFYEFSVYSKKSITVPEAVELLVSIYVQRNSSLWKAKPVMNWLEKNIISLVEKFATKEIIDQGQQVEYWSSFKGPTPRNLLRHIVLSSSDLKVKIPPSASNAVVLDIDPFPPNESLLSYKPRELETNQGQSRSFSNLFIRSFLPSFSLTGEQGPSQQQQQQQQQQSTQQTNNQTGDLAGDLERELNNHVNEYLDEAAEPTDLETSIRNFLISVTSLLIGAENAYTGNSDNTNHHDNDQEGDQNPQ